MNAEEIARRDAELKAEREKLDRERVEFAAAREKQSKDADQAEIDGLVRQAKVLPAERDAVALVFAGLTAGTLDFAGDSPEGKRAAEAKAALSKFLGGLKPRIPLGEVSAPSGDGAIDHAAAGAGEDVGRALGKIRADARAAGEGEIDSAEAARRYRRARA